LQSGEDGVLKKMNRHYTTAQYLEKVNLIRKYFPDAAITTDLICGFPTEDEVSFCRTLKFMDEVGFAQVHVFGYSQRGGTAASRYKLLASDTVKSRVARAIKSAEMSKEKYLQKFIGKTLEVLSEDIENGYLRGYSQEYVKCYLDKGDGDRLYEAVVEKVIDGTAYCRVVAEL
jgi:threonylcarbamoyladenosine tRNA methylthiotransferase MtaB